MPQGSSVGGETLEKKGGARLSFLEGSIQGSALYQHFGEVGVFVKKKEIIPPLKGGGKEQKFEGAIWGKKTVQ